MGLSIVNHTQLPQLPQRSVGIRSRIRRPRFETKNLAGNIETSVHQKAVSSYQHTFDINDGNP